jgi:hypothetical protein
MEKIMAKITEIIGKLAELAELQIDDESSFYRTIDEIATVVKTRRLLEKSERLKEAMK